MADVTNIPWRGRVSTSLIVGVDIAANGDEAVLVIGQQEHGKIKILNAISGPTAIELYQQLITQKKENDHD